MMTTLAIESPPQFEEEKKLAGMPISENPCHPTTEQSKQAKRQLEQLL
jgi:hypothetical protein